MTILHFLLRIYEIILLIRILLSWIAPNPAHPFVQIIYQITEPVLAPIRRVLPMSGFGFDFSPVIVFIIIELLKRLLLGGYYL